MAFMVRMLRLLAQACIELPLLRSFGNTAGLEEDILIVATATVLYLIIPQPDLVELRPHNFCLKGPAFHEEEQLESAHPPIQRECACVCVCVPVHTAALEDRDPNPKG